MNDIEILRKFLEVPLESSEPIFQYFLGIPDKEIVFRGERPERFLYIRGQRKNKVLLVAHADTVWDNFGAISDNAKHELIFSNDVFQSSSSVYGIGADDRAGCAILWLLKDLGHSLLITDGEEIGGLGSNWLMSDPKNSDIADEINSQHQFMIQLDRRHGSDFKCYSVGTDEFRDYVQGMTGYTEPDRFSYTDIVTLCREITGVNLSVGYRYEHSHKESLSVDEWLNTLNICRRWLSKEALPRFPLRKISAKAE
ncbi:MAG: hypothetical protein KME12_10850 [Trichocoleus desertorum ATA4-8-CV12]|jgi:hypothetical protein|nr:hypothetical protein [Trichocoleus desertorum ATA4-8-CV12]